MDWQQQPGESDKAYAKFLAFRNAGSQRSIMGANGGKPNGGLYRQAHKWRWGERASAWDASLRERTDEELVDRMVPARHKLADKADALIERLWDPGIGEATLALSRLTTVYATALGIPRADPPRGNDLTPEQFEVNLRAIYPGENADDGRDDRDGSDGDD